MKEKRGWVLTEVITWQGSGEDCTICAMFKEFFLTWVFNKFSSVPTPATGWPSYHGRPSSHLASDHQRWPWSDHQTWPISILKKINFSEVSSGKTKLWMTLRVLFVMNFLITVQLKRIFKTTILTMCDHETWSRGAFCIFARSLKSTNTYYQQKRFLCSEVQIWWNTISFCCIKVWPWLTIKHGQKTYSWPWLTMKHGHIIFFIFC